METSNEVIWLERLANRCKLHGYSKQAAQLREKADRLNALLPEESRASADDERCLEPVAGGISDFIGQARGALAGT
jgi:hypothetical protein